MFDYSVWQLRQTWVLINTSPMFVRRAFLASPAETSLSLIRHRVAEDTSSRVCYIVRGLLQISSRLVAEDDHWWAAASIECHSTSDLWHRQVRLRSVMAVPRWTALTWHSSAGAVQAMSPEYLADHCIPISEVAGRQHPRSARRQQLNVPRVRRVIGRRTFASLHQLVWQSGIHCQTIFVIRLLDRTSFNEN